MRMFRISILAIAVGVVGLPGFSVAKTLRLSPALTVAATAGESARSAIKFDLTGLTIANVAGAYLELNLTGVSGEARSQFDLFVAESNWSDAGGVSELTLPGEPDATWDIEVRDYKRAGGLVRFNITDIVKNWLDHEVLNAGVVIVTSDMTAKTLSGQLAGAVLLVHD